MTYLPHHRRIQCGRTWSAPYSHASHDPISGPWKRQTTTERVAGVLLAVVIGVIGAASLIHWWAA